MISYQKYVLRNGLTLIVIEDSSTPMVSVNTLYGVGARDEDPSLTGFAHLFEHLMFGGTRNVPDYDRVVTEVGGESNANTNNDFTQYYLTVPAGNLETALWLESDRMRGLDLSEKSLRVQQSVVTEEYNYRYMNQPYGDVWMHLRPLCYKEHPYRWCTIGADIRHVEDATFDDVRSFFDRYYCPSNAIVAVAGDVKAAEVLELVEKWYGDIPSGRVERRALPVEPRQTESRTETIERNVPVDAIYLGYHMCGRLDADFPVCDMISDVLSNGQSARLYNELVKRRNMFSEIDAYITGDRDPGLFVVSGKLREGVDCRSAVEAVEEQLSLVATEPLSDYEIEKVKNKYENTFLFSQYKALDCAMSMCYYEWLGHPEWANTDPEIYRKTTAADVRRVASQIFEFRNLLYVKRHV